MVEEKSERRLRYEARRRARRRRRLIRRISIAVAAVLAVGIVAGVAVALNRAPSSPAVDTAPPLDEKPEVRRPVVVVLGDSYSGGSTMNKGPTWPLRIGEANDWIVGNLSAGGSGYLEIGATGETLTKRVERVYREFTPDIVIIAGGFNDAGKHPAAEIAAEADRMVAELEGVGDAEVVMLSPFSTPDVSAATTELTAALSEVAADRSVPYLDVSTALAGRPELIGVDRIHPTDKGHAVLTRFIEPWLTRQVQALN